MKKLSLIFFAVIASIAGTNAQYTTHNVYHVENPNRPSADHAIVRTDGIAYFEDNGQGYFAYINSLGGTYYEVKLPNNNWSVWDFRVLDGVAYFCGKDRFTNTALLGDFNIANLVSGSGSITFNYDINIGNSFAVLTRIAVASLKDTVSLMAIGQTDPNNDPNLEGSDQLLYIKD